MSNRRLLAFRLLTLSSRDLEYGSFDCAFGALPSILDNATTSRLVSPGDFGRHISLIVQYCFFKGFGDDSGTLKFLAEALLGPGHASAEISKSIKGLGHTWRLENRGGC